MTEFFQPPHPGPLYHYTGIQSLLGIQDTREVWAGNIHYMNDSEELIHAIQSLQDYLLVRINSSLITDRPIQPFLQGLARWAEDCADSLSRHHLYIFSLSEEPSLLSQWRSYTPHGKGISIGFSHNLLEGITNANKLTIGKCVYIESEKTRLFDELTSRLRYTLDERTPGANLNVMEYRSAINAEAKNIIRILALIKHEAFSEEREWRLISAHFAGLDSAHFRAGASMLVPYQKWKLPQLDWMFDEIILGPTPHPELSYESLVAMTHQHKLANMLRRCDIPYRVW
jgi:hypothetical protein